MAWISFTYGDKVCFEFLVAWDAVAHTSNERTGLALLAPTAISEVPRPRDLNGSWFFKRMPLSLGPHTLLIRTASQPGVAVPAQWLIWLECNDRILYYAPQLFIGTSSNETWSLPAKRSQFIPTVLGWHDSLPTSTAIIHVASQAAFNFL